MPAAAEPRRVTVTLELDLSAEPIRGVARDSEGAERPFTGWLGLARALELTLDAANRASATPSARMGGGGLEPPTSCL